jgi:cell division septum initiation protein DivIVA
MSEHSELLSEGGMEWEREVRGYNRQQVDNYVAWRAGQVREMESRLSQSIAEIEHLRQELGDARQAARRPPHEEISERVGQILKLAADEAKSEREHGMSDANDLRDAAKDETEKLRAEAKQEVDRLKTDAQERAERMLTAAQEQADRAVGAATSEAEEMVSSAHAAAEKTVSEANQHAESTVGAAMAQAKQQLDEATARATAIHDGAERRLNLLISRHTETVRRLTEIRDVVTSLVSGEVSRGSLEDEVNRALGAQQAPNGTATPDSRGSGQHELPQAGPQRGQRQAGPAESRRAVAQRDEPAEQPPAQAHAAQAQATPARPPAAARAGHAAAAHEQDPLSLPSQRQGARNPAEGVQSGKHATDAALQAAEEIRQARSADRVLDETAASSASRKES